MAIELRCHVCGRTFSHEHDGRGSTRCPYCQVTAQLPAGGAAGSAGVAGGSAGDTSAAAQMPSFGAHNLSGDASSPWHVYSLEGKQYGPIEKSELDRWVQENRLTPQCQVIQQGWVNWKFAGEVYPHLQLKAGTSSNNPYAAPAHGDFQPAALAPPAFKPPHRGEMILVLGILGWALCFLFAPFAWAMGASDLKAMKAGRMNDSGHGLTLAGMILGMIQSILIGVIVLFYVVIFIASAI